MSDEEVMYVNGAPLDLSVINEYDARRMRTVTVIRPQVVRFNLELSMEEDGRWIADFTDMPGIHVYGTTRAESIHKAADLLARVLDARDKKEAG